MRLPEIRQLSLRDLTYYIEALNKRAEAENPTVPVDGSDEYAQETEKAFFNTPGARL